MVQAFVQFCLFVLALTKSLSPTLCKPFKEQLINVSKLQMFVDDLPDMPRLLGYDFQNETFIHKKLKIGMFARKWKFHRDLPLAKVFAYGTSRVRATVPGPTIEVVRGVETRVEWKNKLPRSHILPWDPTIRTATARSGIPTVTHLHGGITSPQSDGHGRAWFTKDWKEKGPAWSSKVFHYPNQQQPGNAWYHDHAMGLTRVNLLAGLIGFYIIQDPDVEKTLGLPAGPEFDRPLVIFDRSFRMDGSIYMNRTGDNPSIHPQWQPEYFGDAMVVNGKAWPKLNVHQRKYRFRILNASNARFLRLSLSCGSSFTHLGSDSAYLPRPVTNSKFLLAPSEIADVVIDFSTSICNEIILFNDAPCPFPSGNLPDEFSRKIMKFVIGEHEHYSRLDPFRVPLSLLQYSKPYPTHASAERFIVMYEYESNIGMPTRLYLNGKSFDEPITETPVEGTTELWTIINLTDDNHPLHIHLCLFVVLEQRMLVDVDRFRKCMMVFNNPTRCNLRYHARGATVPVPAHERGWKNVFKMQPRFSTKILLQVSLLDRHGSYPFNASAEPGYVYHCHILDHEDNEMMRPFKIMPKT